MTGRTRKHGFASRPGDPDSWIKATDTPSTSKVAGEAFTARLTIDITPELRGRIKRSRPSGAASPSPTCCATCSRATRR